jgi:SAM-dependent methyltransferase
VKQRPQEVEKVLHPPIKACLGTHVRHLLVYGLLSLGILMLAACKAREEPKESSLKDIGDEYNVIYVATDRGPHVPPNDFLMKTIRETPGVSGQARSALDIGSGNGRNSIFLAREGYSVTAVDLSRIGLDLTKEKAVEEGLKIETVLSDINQFDLGVSRWDLVVLIDFPFPYQALLPKIARALKPGGLIIIEAVSVNEPQRRDQPMVFTHMRHSDLENPFRGFRKVYDQEALWPSVWGGQARMIRFVARKSADPA